MSERSLHSDYADVTELRAADPAAIARAWQNAHHPARRCAATAG